MRIAVVSTMEGFAWGGSERLWSAMASVALQSGHEVFVSVKHWPDAPPEVAALREAGATISTRRIYPDAGLRQRLANKLLRRNRWRSWEEVTAPAPDVIVINQGGTFDCCASYYRELFDLCTTGTTPYAVLCRANAESDIPAAADRGRAAELFTKASLVAVAAAGQIPLMERQIGAKVPNARVVRSPVTIESPELAEPWTSASRVRLANVARLDVRAKGQDVLLATLGSPAWRGRDWALSLFGDGGDAEYLASLARHYAIDDRVTFRGHVSDVRAIWREHDLLVLPSRYEGTPLAMIEAMLCGRPAVVTDVGGATEWVEDGASGFVAESPSEKYLGRALERAWAARPRWEEIGRAARLRALTLYDPDPGRTLLGILCECAAAVNAC